MGSIRVENFVFYKSNDYCSKNQVLNFRFHHFILIFKLLNNFISCACGISKTN